MTPAHGVATPTVWRSIGAIVAGLIVTVAGSTVMDMVMYGTGAFPPPEEPKSDALWLWATTYRFVFAALGCYVAARLAPKHPARHAWILGGVGLCLGLLGAVLTWEQGPAFGPKWYAIVVALSAIPTAWLGGIIRERQLTRPSV